MANAVDVYRRMQREAVPDEASMGVLMRVLCESILVGRRALDRMDYATADRHLIAAQQTLIHLRAGIPQGSGEVGENLGGLYAWSERTLGQANIEHDTARIDEVVAVLGNIRDAFEGIQESEVMP